VFPRRLAAFTAEAAATSRALKQFLHAKVYASAALGQDRQQSMIMLGELFRFFLDHPDRLPQPYCQQALVEPAHRVVCDYIAGMTDAFFHRTYEQTIGPAA
jgi:dGTPase